MKKEIKICLPLYKICYSFLFVFFFSLVRGVGGTEEIGIAVDTEIGILAIIFCGDTYDIERREKRRDIFRLFPLKKQIKVMLRRLAVQMLYLVILSILGYGMFYWQAPRNSLAVSSWFLFGIFLLAVLSSVFFWSVLSMMLTTAFRSLPAGSGTALCLWMLLNSTFGEKLLGAYNVFSFGFRRISEVNNWNWLWGKGAAVLLSIGMMLLMPEILKKRG